MARALKVFSYSDGFHAWTVATSSRAKALAAWGVTRDLFSDGSAREIHEGPDHAAALAHPGELIERGLSVDIGPAPRKAAKSREPSAKARARLEQLKAELRSLDEAQAGEAAELEQRRRALDDEIKAQTARHEKAHAALQERIKAARAKLG